MASKHEDSLAEDDLELLEDGVEREDSALEDLKAVQAAIADDEEDDDDSLGGMSLGFGAQASASIIENIAVAGNNGQVYVLAGKTSAGLATLGSIDPGAPGGNVYAVTTQSDGEIISIDGSYMYRHHPLYLDVEATAGAWSPNLLSIAARSDDDV